MRTQTKLIAILLALVLAAAACGSSDDEDATADEGFDSEESFAATTTTMADAGQLEASDDEETAEESADLAETDAAAPASGAAEGGFFDEPAPPEQVDEESATFQDYGIRPFVATSQDPLSTFALDVDTASYSIAKRWVAEGSVPPPESVRVEEYVNSFDYDYPVPGDGLTVVADGGPSPFDGENVIVRLGVQAADVSRDERPPANLTFVVDTSGSMEGAGRLGLVQTALRQLVAELDGEDSVAIVTYSDNASVLLPPTSAARSDVILDAIDGLATTGSTNLEAGLATGYDLANEAFIDDGINRVVLASDGVANVGLTDPTGLVAQIRDDADRGIQLVTIGVGMGNFNDVTMEQLANDGDGFYAYVNDTSEASRLFSDDLISTLVTVAIDGKIQVEFDDSTVAQYRLIGFENRAVLDDDFRNDAVDAGELGAGHQVTAIYELTLHSGVSASDRLGTAQLRWEDPDEGTVRETRLELTGAMLADQWGATDEDFRLAVTVAALAEILRESPYVGDVDLAQVRSEAEALSPGSGPVEELVQLVSDIDVRR